MTGKETDHIFVGENFKDQLTSFLSDNNFSEFFVLVDEHTVQYCYTKVVSLLPQHIIIQVKSGEKNKTLQSCELIWDRLTTANADRSSLLINLGGGMLCDIGGFAAGCYKRGIKFINIPTTLLAMVDASVGGKTGIDFHCFKNQIGLFNEPEGVFINTGFLSTLPDRELLSGFAEVIKHYLIADKEAFETIRNSQLKIRSFSWDDIVGRNIGIKSSFVEKDPHEKGIRKALNFGHTVGHAIESYFLKDERQKLLHGEAVAAGLICESFVSAQMNFIAKGELETIANLISLYFTLPVVPEFDFAQILLAIQQDKKNITGKNQFTLLKGIGNYHINCFVEEQTMIDSLKYYNALLT